MSVILTFRRLGGAQFMLSADLSATISTIKSILQSGHAVDSNSRLLFRGKVLSDDQTISSLALQPDDFIIILPQAGTAAARQPLPPRPPPASEKPARKVDATPEQPSIEPLPSPFGAPNAAGARRPPAVDPANFADLVTNLMDAVSVPKDQCEDALRTADYDVERAAGLLLNDPGESSTGAASPDAIFEQLFEALAAVTGLPTGPTDQEDEVEPEDEVFGGFTDAEKAQIQRLQEVTGCDRQYVIQVFLACEKDEETTANCLLEGK